MTAATTAPARPQTIGCERCRFPNALDHLECVNCRWPIDAYVRAAQDETQRRDLVKARNPFPVLDLCGPQLRVLDLANQIRSATYWRMVRELAEKAYEVGPHDHQAQRDVMRLWWKERAAESEAAEASPSADRLDHKTLPDVALNPINILNWSAHLDGFEHRPSKRFLAAAEQPDTLAFLQHIAECAFFDDVDAEILLIAEQADAGTDHESGHREYAGANGGTRHE